ncbi:MAG TPA: hypothetical protein VGB79_00370 [Allosphingosinicella sp.]|jgi:hypothetical protein
MTDWLGRIAALLLGVLALSGCSMETAINAMSTAEDRQFAQDFVANVRAGDEGWLEQHMHPGLWARTSNMVAARKGLFGEGGPGTTTLVGYQVSAMQSGGRSSRTVSFTLITETGRSWTETRFEAVSENDGPLLVSDWLVLPHGRRPAALNMFETSKKAVPWLWGFSIALILGLVAIVWAVVRSRRRRREAAARL